MKKLLLPFLFILFFSCSSDDNNDNNDGANYIEPNLISGRWKGHDNLSSYTVLTFNSGKTVFATYSTSSNEVLSYFRMGYYLLTADEIMYNTGESQTYKLSNDTLYLAEGIDAQMISYVKMK